MSQSAKCVWKRKLISAGSCTILKRKPYAGHVVK